MLLRTLLLLALVSVLSIILLESTLALAAATLHTAAERSADRAYEQARAALQTFVANQLAGGASPTAGTFAVPPPTRSCAAPTGKSQGCGLSIQVTLRNSTLGGVSAPAPNCLPLCAHDVQTNDAVAEGRAAFSIGVEVTDATGRLLASRQRFVLLRTLRVTPFTEFVGSRDAGDDAFAAGSSEGDDGGPTRVNVLYRNTTTGASLSGDALKERAWNNGDARSNAWAP